MKTIKFKCIYHVFLCTHICVSKTVDDKYFILFSRPENEMFSI